MDPKAKEYFLDELAILMKKEYMVPLLSQIKECQSVTNTKTDNLQSNLQRILELMQRQQQEIESLKALNNFLQLQLELLDTKVYGTYWGHFRKAPLK